MSVLKQDADKTPFLIKKDVYGNVRSIKVSGDAGGELLASIQKTNQGLSYLVAESGITIVSSSNGQIKISSTGGGGGSAPTTAQYIVLSADATLTDERVFTVNSAFTLDDAGAGSSLTLGFRDSVFATISGSTFTGACLFNQGLSGSLTKLTDGTSFIYAGSGITVTTASNGQVTIAAVGSFTPILHASTHNAGGSDELAIDAAANVASFRTLGTTSTQAAPGDNPTLNITSTQRIATLGIGTAVGTAGTIKIATVNPAVVNEIGMSANGRPVAFVDSLPKELLVAGDELSNTLPDIFMLMGA